MQLFHTICACGLLPLLSFALAQGQYTAPEIVPLSISTTPTPTAFTTPRPALSSFSGYYNFSNTTTTCTGCFVGVQRPRIITWPFPEPAKANFTTSTTSVTITATIVPVVTVLPDGTSSTISNSTIYGGAPTTASNASFTLPTFEPTYTWVEDGVALTYPTTYLFYSQFIGGKDTAYSFTQTAPVTTCSAQSFRPLEGVPTIDNSALFYPAETIGDSLYPTTVPPPLITYLNGLSTIREQYNGDPITTCSTGTQPLLQLTRSAATSVVFTAVPSPEPTLTLAPVKTVVPPVQLTTIAVLTTQVGKPIIYQAPIVNPSKGQPPKPEPPKSQPPYGEPSQEPPKQEPPKPQPPQSQNKPENPPTSPTPPPQPPKSQPQNPPPQSQPQGGPSPSPPPNSPPQSQPPNGSPQSQPPNQPSQSQPPNQPPQPTAGVITIGTQPVSIAPVTTPGATGGYVINSQTLLPGSSMTINGVVYSLPTAGSSIVAGGTTIAVPIAIPTGAPNSPNSPQTPYPIILTAGSTTITAMPSGTSPAYIVAPGTTLSPGGPAITISGTTFSLPTATAAGALPTVVVVNGQTSTLGAPATTTDLGGYIISGIGGTPGVTGTGGGQYTGPLATGGAAKGRGRGVEGWLEGLLGAVLGLVVVGL